MHDGTVGDERHFQTVLYLLFLLLCIPFFLECECLRHNSVFDLRSLSRPDHPLFAIRLLQERISRSYVLTSAKACRGTTNGCVTASLLPTKPQSEGKEVHTVNSISFGLGIHDL
eukprot:COSAG01_NODE_39486_length_475_cov_41.680851_1_plen_113_part_10